MNAPASYGVGPAPSASPTRSIHRRTSNSTKPLSATNSTQISGNGLNTRSSALWKRCDDMGIISRKLRASAKGQPCTFQIPGICSHDSSTTVLCHLPSDIKGIGNKSDDFHAAFGCAKCHEVIDNHRLSAEDCLYYSMRALQRTLHIWVQSGLVFVPADTPRPKPSSKILPRRHLATGEIL